jgi:hypothetical protein
MASSSIEKAKQLLINAGLEKKLITSEQIRVHSLLYMVYWFNRLENNTEEQKHIKDNLEQYLSKSKVDVDDLIKGFYYEQLLAFSNQYVKEEILPIQTVDLIIEKDNVDSNLKEVLLFERPGFPQGISLPGGLVEDSDEDNELNIDQKTFAALRVAAEKVLYLNQDEQVYKINHKEDGEIYYSVENKLGNKKIIIHPQNIYGYSINENLKSVIRPSDPRHLVDTIGFKCEIIDNDTKEKEYFWETKENLLNHNLQHSTQNFAFNHHKEIILHTLAKTSVENEMNFNETKFIKDIIEKPLDSYNSFMERFKENNFNPYTSFPELFPTVNKVMNELFSDEINTMCEENEILIGFRDKVVNSLRHVSLKNRVFCPYLPTVQAIFDSIAFFDVVARQKKEFYKDLSTSEIIEHNPKQTPNASYHMYKYQYRMNELLSKIPDEIIIPTFTATSATDLMKVRGVPIRFVGLSTDFIYVDEFEQSPEEFLMHDGNHSYRMMIEDEKYMADNHLSKEDFINQHHGFISQYLPSIKISSQDTEEEKELKKIKKIILFEVCHEDAKPLMPEIILSALVRKEGGETKFELPIIDEKTHYLDIVDVLDTEISTLSYVRNKLQCGFYDKVDKQNTQIVNPKYRKSDFIAKAALEMVNELSTMLNKKVDVDYEYLLRRICSVGPNNIYEAYEDDENLKKYGDGASYLNPKRYTSNQHSSENDNANSLVDTIKQYRENSSLEKKKKNKLM